MPEEKPSDAPAGQPTPDPAKAEAPKPQDPKADPKTPKAGDPQADPDDFKSEESKKAVLADLAKEREARKALEARFEKLGEAFGVQKPENGKTDIDQLTERLAKHEEAIASERQARWRAEVANEKGLTAEQAARLVGSTREELSTDADALKALFPSTPGIPKPDPSQGGKGGSGVNLDTQIQEAQKKGDWRTVLSLQNQKLAEQPK